MYQTHKGDVIRECTDALPGLPAIAQGIPWIVVHVIPTGGVMVAGLKRVIRSWVTVTP